MAEACVFVPQLKGGDVRSRHDFHFVASRLERRFEVRVMLPRQPSDEERHAVALGDGKLPLDRAAEMGRVPPRARVGHCLEPGALGFDTTPNLFFNFLTARSRRTCGAGPHCR